MPVTIDLAREILQKAKSLSDEAEVYIHLKKQLKIDVLNQKIESMDDVSDGGLSVRLIKNNRMGFAYTADFDESALDLAVSQAANNMGIFPADVELGFPGPAKQSKNIELVDKDIVQAKLEDKVQLAMNAERAAYALDKRVKKSEKVFYEDIFTITILANSKGVNIAYNKAVCGLFAEVIAEDAGLMETGMWLMFSNKYKELDPGNIGSEAARRAVYMLGAKPEKSGKAPVVLSPYAASTLVSALSPALSAEYVQKGKSIFRNSLEKPVASRKLTLIDCGILETGISSVPYDDEGIPTGETILIKDGYLKSFLHNNATAKKDNIRSTANSFRGSFKSQPEIQPSNLYVKQGLNPQSMIIDGISKGFLITNIMGAHTINPISGDFSIGFSGFLIENGKQTKPVRGMTIAGNILDIFNHIEEIGSDLMFFPHNGNIGTPSMLVASLSVSGA